jgi:hypothetical protein
MKSRLNATVVLFNQESKEIMIESAVDTSGDVIETEGMLLHLEHATTFVDPKKKNLVYVFNLDYPAKVEAENLKLLRRSVTLKQLFNFERGTGQIDWLKWLPYVIIMLMVVFRK